MQLHHHTPAAPPPANAPAAGKTVISPHDPTHLTENKQTPSDSDPIFKPCEPIISPGEPIFSASNPTLAPRQTAHPATPTATPKPTPTRRFPEKNTFLQLEPKLLNKTQHLAEIHNPSGTRQNPRITRQNPPNRPKTQPQPDNPTLPRPAPVLFHPKGKNRFRYPFHPAEKCHKLNPSTHPQLVQLQVGKETRERL